MGGTAADIDARDIGVSGITASGRVTRDIASTGIAGDIARAVDGARGITATIITTRTVTLADLRARRLGHVRPAGPVLDEGGRDRPLRHR